MRSSSRRHPAVSSDLDPRNRKLSSEAREVLSLALASAEDARLRDAAIIDVAPHPDASCLLVVVAAPADELELVRKALADARGYLRRELASEIQRKRAPELTFRVLPTLDALV